MLVMVLKMTHKQQLTIQVFRTTDYSDSLQLFAIILFRFSSVPDDLWFVFILLASGSFCGVLMHL